MTVQTTTKRADYTGNGSTTTFSVPFYFLDNSHLKVLSTALDGTVTTLVLNSDYTVSGAGVGVGGSITTATAPANGVKISILRNVPLTQLTHYVPNDPFPAASHENALDLLTMIGQQLDEQNNRALTLSENASGVSTQLPTPLANKLIGWNETATGLQNMDPATLATIVAFGTAQADTFTGDGSTKNFTLAYNPGAQANLDVSVGGVTQIPGIDYTWGGGTTLAFVSAPPNGVKILARYMQALPQGSYDSASASFMQSGAGAVQRNAQDKMRETVSVLDFGADPTGATDSTAALVAAIATGKRVLIPANCTVLYTPPLALNTDGVWIFGENRYTSKLVPAATAASAIKIDSTYAAAGIVLDNIRLTGNATCTNAIEVGNVSPQYAATMLNLRNCYIEGFSNATASLLLLNACWWVNIHNCNLEGGAYGINIPANGVVTTLEISGNTTIRNQTVNAFRAAGTTAGALDFVNFRNVSFEYVRQQVIYSRVPKAVFALDNCYFEQNNYAAGAVGQIDVTGDGTATGYAMVYLDSCKTDTPLNNGWHLTMDTTRAELRRCTGFLSTNAANPFTTTTASVLDLYMNQGRSSGDVFAVAKALANGKIRVYDYDSTTFKTKQYCSTGNLFDNHIGAHQATAPTIAAGADAGTGGSYALQAGSNDTHGKINFTKGTGSVGGAFIRVTFNKAYATPPAVSLTYEGYVGAAATFYAVSTTTYFDVGFNAVPPSGPLVIHYQVMGN